MESRRIQALLCALALGTGAAMAAAAPTMSKDAYKAAGKRIAAQEKADLKACARFKANARDICELQAKGKSRFARATLDAQYQPSPENEREAKEAKANADYAIAKERCEDARQGKPRDACLDRAQNEREAAIRQAKIERVISTSEAREKRKESRAVGKPESPAQRYAAEKARCEMLGMERDHCLADARQRFHKG